jgi:CrcB protein
MLEIFLVFIGAGIGGVARFILGSLVYAYTGRYFPYGTLAINITGSFFIGVLFVIISQRFTNLAPYLTAFLLVGILGGYTTFSSLTLETLQLIWDGKIVAAFLNIGLSIFLGLLAVFFGVKLGQKLILWI